MNDLKAAIVKEGVEGRVSFVGELHSGELRNWYAASDVVVCPSYYEGLGRVLLEAQAMKRAVVAYDVGGVAEAVLHGVSGYLVKKGDTEELARRLKDMLENQGKRCEMGMRGRAFVVERFSLDSLTARHERFYMKILEQIDYNTAIVGASKST